MKQLKIVSLVILSALALMSFVVSSASATTFEAEGIAKNTSIEIAASLKPETLTFIKRTDGELHVSCTGTSMAGSTISPFTAFPPEKRWHGH